MSTPDELRNIRDHLRSGHFGQREVWERQLEEAAAEIELLKAESDISDELLADAKAEIERLLAELKIIKQHSVGIALEAARRALERKPCQRGLIPDERVEGPRRALETKP